MGKKSLFMVAKLKGKENGSKRDIYKIKHEIVHTNYQYMYIQQNCIFIIMDIYRAYYTI